MKYKLFSCKIYKYFFIFILLICAIILTHRMYSSTFNIIEGADIYDNPTDNLERTANNEKRKKEAVSKKSDNEAKKNSETETKYQ